MKKENLYLVCQSRSCYGNVLGYNLKTSECVYLHFGEEIWREKGDRALFDYMNECRANREPADSDECEKYAIYNKYSQSTEEMVKLCLSKENIKNY